MPADMQKARDLILHAVGKLPPEQWNAYVAEACGGDAELHRQAAHLLQVHREAGSFLEKPADTGPFRPSPSDLQPPAPVDLAGSRIGPYKLLQKLGEGGMGTVYVADQEEPVRRRAAVKIIKPGMDSAHIIARFEQERQALAMMDHPNIAKVLDAGTTGGEPGGVSPGRPYFVMELVKGIPITKFCDQEHLTPRERLELFIPVCLAVQHAHQKGIIHRDLKPSNVLIALYDGKPLAKVIDFGVAKATAQRLTGGTVFTEIGQMVGTLEYMSPEQAELNNLDIDTRADIYSLGVLLYELLTGSPPFTRQQLRGAAFTEMLRMIKEVEPHRPSTKLSSSAELPSIAANRKLEPKKLAKLVRGDLDWIIMKCLEKERSRRYETANGLALEVQRYLHHEPVLAGPPSAVYRLRKFVRRNRGAVLAAIIVVLTLVGGIAGTTMGLLRARQAEAEAREEATQKEIARAAEEQQRQEADLQRRQAVAEKNRAVKAESDAKTQAAIAQAVNHFLQVDLLGQADIGKQPLQRGSTERNRNITVGELLDRAAKAVDSKFANQPLTEAAIRRTVGESYLALGRYADALPHLERSVNLYIARFGDEHPDTVLSKYTLGWVYFRLGQYRRAEPLYRASVEALATEKGAGHLETVLMKNALAVVIKEQGRLAEAEPLYLEVSEQLTRLLGPANPNALLVKVNLAALYLEQEKYLEAEQILIPACRLLDSELGPNHPANMLSKNILVSVYQGQAKYAQSEPLAKELLQMREKYLGVDHPDTLISKGSLGVTYWGMGRLEESIPLFEEVLRARKIKLGEKHAYTLNGAADLASNYRDAGRLDEALQVVEEWLPRGQAAFGPTHPAVRYVMDTAVSIYERRGEPAKAEPMLRELLDITKQTHGAESREYGRRLASLGANLLMQKKPDAEEWLRQALAIAERHEPDFWKTFAVKSALGGALLLQQKYADAAPLLLQGYEGLKQRLDKMAVPNRKVRLTEAAERLMQLYETTDKKDEAAKWRMELETLKAAAKAAPQP